MMDATLKCYTCGALLSLPEYGSHACVQPPVQNAGVEHRESNLSMSDNERYFNAGVNSVAAIVEKKDREISALEQKLAGHASAAGKLEAARQEARAEAFKQVREAAEKIYEENLDSNPSDWVYMNRAVDVAEASPASQSLGSPERVE